jgi:hypothetical protein
MRKFAFLLFCGMLSLEQLGSAAQASDSSKKMVSEVLPAIIVWGLMPTTPKGWKMGLSLDQGQPHRRQRGCLQPGEYPAADSGLSGCLTKDLKLSPCGSFRQEPGLFISFTDFEKGPLLAGSTLPNGPGLGSAWFRHQP